VHRRRRERLEQDRVQLVAFMARPSSHRRMQRCAEQIHIGARVDRFDFAEHHFGRHERRRSDDRRAAQIVRVGRLDVHRDAPIEQVRFSERTDHDVLGLDVAMHVAAHVRKMKSIGDAHQHLDDHAEAIFVAPQELGPRWMIGIAAERIQRHALDALHHEDG
jgi:hypothetical protein